MFNVLPQNVVPGFRVASQHSEPGFRVRADDLVRHGIAAHDISRFGCRPWIFRNDGLGI